MPWLPQPSGDSLHRSRQKCGGAYVGTTTKYLPSELILLGQNNAGNIRSNEHDNRAKRRSEIPGQEDVRCVARESLARRDVFSSTLYSSIRNAMIFRLFPVGWQLLITSLLWHYQRFPAACCPNCYTPVFWKARFSKFSEKQKLLKISVLLLCEK